MRKGAYITLTVFVKGEDEPANDFVSLVTKALIWAVGQIVSYPDRKGLSVDIKKVFEDTQDLEDS